MKNAGYWVVSMLLVMVGCVPSLHELYTDETLVFDPAIAGKWQQEKDDAVWEFEPDAESKSYALMIHEEEDKQSELTVHLVEIGGKRFFDLFPADDAEIETGDWMKAHLIPGHLFVRVEQTEPNLVLAVMNPDTLDKLLKDKPGLVKHERMDDRLVLTDSPKGLQAFITAGLKIDKFFGDPVTLKRIAAPEPAKP
jgi:hypothetical protein